MFFSIPLSAKNYQAAMGGLQPHQDPSGCQLMRLGGLRFRGLKFTVNS